MSKEYDIDVNIEHFNQKVKHKQTVTIIFKDPIQYKKK